MLLWGHLSLGSPEPDFIFDSQALSIFSLCAGRKYSGAVCILQENKSKWFCAPGIRQKAQNDNLSVTQSDNLKTFKVIFSISFREDIFSTVWIKMFKQWPWKHLPFPIYLPATLRDASLLTAKLELLHQSVLVCYAFFTVKSFCWAPEAPICCWANIKTACGKRGRQKFMHWCPAGFGWTVQVTSISLVLGC